MLKPGHGFRKRPSGKVLHVVSDTDNSGKAEVLTLCGQRFTAHSWRRWIADTERLCLRCEERVRDRGLWVHSYDGPQGE